MPPNARPTFVHPIAIRELEVVRTEDVTPGLRRVTLTGDQLGEFVSAQGLVQAGFVSTGFDDEVRLVFPYPGESEPVLPVAKADGGLGFPRGVARCCGSTRFAGMIPSCASWTSISWCTG